MNSIGPQYPNIEYLLLFTRNFGGELGEDKELALNIPVESIINDAFSEGAIEASEYYGLSMGYSNYKDKYGETKADESYLQIIDKTLQDNLKKARAELYKPKQGILSKIGNVLGKFTGAAALGKEVTANVAGGMLGTTVGTAITANDKSFKSS